MNFTNTSCNLNMLSKQNKISRILVADALWRAIIQELRKPLEVEWVGWGGGEGGRVVKKVFARCSKQRNPKKSFHQEVLDFSWADDVSCLLVVLFATEKVSCTWKNKLQLTLRASQVTEIIMYLFPVPNCTSIENIYSTEFNLCKHESKSIKKAFELFRKC